jgi:hypothetical protein
MAVLAEAFVNIKTNLAGLKTGLLEANKMMQVGLGGVGGALSALALSPAQLGFKSLADTIAHGVTVAMGFENQYDDLRDRLQSTGQADRRRSDQGTRPYFFPSSRAEHSRW